MTKHKEMAKALDVLKILSHPVRLSILCNLIEKGEMCAGDIVKQEQELASQSQVSQYLKMLRDENIIQARKNGQHVYYKISSLKIKLLIEKMYELFCRNQ